MLLSCFKLPRSGALSLSFPPHFTHLARLEPYCCRAQARAPTVDTHPLR